MHSSKSFILHLAPEEKIKQPDKNTADFLKTLHLFHTNPVGIADRFSSLKRVHSSSYEVIHVGDINEQRRSRALVLAGLHAATDPHNCPVAAGILEKMFLVVY